MEKIRNKKVTITVGLLILVALLASVAFGIWFDNSDEAFAAYTINGGAINATIGNHGVGTVSTKLAPGQESQVLERHNASAADTQVVWIYDENDLRNNLETASGPASNAGAGKILIFANDVNWAQSNIANDVGTQKFTGILDGNGYKLNIVFSAPVDGGGTAKSGNDSYYKVTQNDIGESSNNFSGTDGGGARGMGLIVGVNAGTIANLTVNYSAKEGAMQAANNNGAGNIADSNSLDSAQNPDVPYGYGIVAGINIGTISNVYVNQTSIFNGNTKADTDWSWTTDQSLISEHYENCAAVGGITGINMGYGVVTNCYMYVGNAIYAQADGADMGGVRNPGFAATFAGGLVGWIRGDNSQLTYCYLDGNGEINSWAMRGKKNTGWGSQGYPWSLAFAGGVTSGKIRLYREDVSVIGYTCYADAQGLGANQIKGIISNWTGQRRDSYGSNSYLDKLNPFTGSTRVNTGMPFDFLYSADQSTDMQDLIVFTYNYKAVTNNETLDMPHVDGDGDAVNAKMNANWSEVYGWEHSGYQGDATVSVTFEGSYLRIQAKSSLFMQTQQTQLEEITRATSINGYQPKYTADYQGSFVWGVDIYEIGASINPETNITSNVYKPTDNLGSLVQYYNTSMSKGSYVVKFGATYDYELKSANVTSRQYNGDAMTDMMPTLLLKDKSGATVTVNENDGKFKWVISAASTSSTLERNLAIYPDTYYIQPYAVIGGEENKDYAYYDETARTIAFNKSLSTSAIITKATLSLTYNYSDSWVKSAVISVGLTSEGFEVNKPIISAYSYQGGNNNNIIDIANVSNNNSFTITETTSTPENGRTIYNVTAYAKKADGTYVAVADTSRASTQYKTALIKVDSSAPVLGKETYYDISQFASYSTLEEMYNAWISDKDAFSALSSEDILNGRWYNHDVIAFVESNDENRSGITSVSLTESSNGSNFSTLASDRYYSNITDGSAVTVVKITTVPFVNITLSDRNNNSVTLGINGGNKINVDKTPITVNNIITDYTDYNRNQNKSYSKFQITFNATFGGAGLYMWYYIDNNTTLADDDETVPEDAVWTRYEFSSNVTSNTTVNTFIPEGMENAALFIKFTSAVDGYDVAEPVVQRISATIIGIQGDFKKFTVDLNGAVIDINAKILEIYDSETGRAYQLDSLINNNIVNLDIAEFFTKTYDGTANLKSTLEFRFKVDENTMLEEGVHYTGDFYATTYQSSFTAKWLKPVAKYSSVNAGNVMLEISVETSEECPIEMNISIDYGNGGNSEKVKSVGTKIEKLNMAFDINQIFTEGTDIELSGGSYVTSGGVVTFNWTYGDVFDGLVASIYNNESGGTMYFRFNCLGKGTEVYMNAGGNYSAYVDAIKIDSPVYEMDDFAQLSKIGDKYVGDAGVNYTVEISGEIKINVQQKKVRLTFAFDGLTSYNFNIPYDSAKHVVTAAYTDIDGKTQYAKITWKKPDGSDTTLTGITEIGSHTAVATIEDSNYAINGQSQQTFTIIATDIELYVPDKVVQYNDGNTLSYIPDLPEGSALEGKNIKFTITYYQKLGTSLKLLGVNYNITEVGEYYVRVYFDPTIQDDPELQKYVAKEYTKEGSSGSDLNYILFSVVKADTVINGVENQTSVYNKGLQSFDASKAKLLSKETSKELTQFSDDVILQYWDEATQSYVAFDATSIEGKYKNVGTYKYRLYFAGDENYNPTYSEYTLTINNATVNGVVFGSEIKDDTVIGVKKVYDGKELSLAASIENSNVKGEEGVVIEYRKYAIGGYSSDPPSFVSVSRSQVWVRITCPNYDTYETSAYIIITSAPYPNDALSFDSANPGGQLTVEYDGKEHSIAYTLNTGKYGESNIYADGTMVSMSNAGEYAGTITVYVSNYESYTYETLLTITPKKVSAVDDSVIQEIQNTQGLTSDTDLTQLKVTFEGVDGKDVDVELIFWDENNKMVFLDSYGTLPAGTYKVTYDAGDNYDLSGVKTGTLTLAEGTGERPHDHVDSDGDGKCDICNTDMSSGGSCQHKDENKDGICDLCGASLASVTNPKETPDVGMYIVLAVCGVLIVASIAGVIVAAVVKSKKKKNNNRYNII